MTGSAWGRFAVEQAHAADLGPGCGDAFGIDADDGSSSTALLTSRAVAVAIRAWWPTPASGEDLVHRASAGRRSVCVSFNHGEKE